MTSMRYVWICFVLLSVSALAFAQSDARLVTAPAAVDLKAERARLTAEILAQKEAGHRSDAALSQALAALEPRTAVGALDQGNDACPATVIASVPFTDNGTTSGKANSSISCGNNTSPDVIYQFTPTTGGVYSFSLCGSAYDTRLEVRHGGSCPGTVQDRCNDDSCGTASWIVMALSAGTTYFVIVDGYLYATDAGSYTLSVSFMAAPTTGETCASALPLTIPGTVSGTTSTFQNDYQYSCPISDVASPDVVYAYTAARALTATFSLCTGTTAYDTKLLLYAGSCTGTPVACNDDACQAPLMSMPWASKIECVALAAGTTYYLVVDGYNGAHGNYTLTASICGTGGPANDNCSAVTPATLPLNATGDNTGATHDCDALQAGEGEVWHAFTITYTSQVRVHVCGSSGNWGAFYNTLETSCPCASSAIFATSSIWDAACTHGGISLYYNDLPAGTYYYPVIYHTVNHSVGAYEIQIVNLTPPPSCTPTETVHLEGPAAQSACATLCPTTPSQIQVRPLPGQTFSPERRPVLHVAAGCAGGASLCSGNSCSPAESWVYEPTQWLLWEGSWYGSISGGPGCVCISMETILPVELQQFSAAGEAGNVVLRWSTGSESDNDHFEIQRNQAIMATIPSKGNGAEGHSYQWMDADAEAGRELYLYAGECGRKRRARGTGQRDHHAARSAGAVGAGVRALRRVSESV